MYRYFRREKLYKVALLLISFTIAIAIGEMSLRIFSTNTYYVWTPNLKMTFRLLPRIMPGISGESRFYLNSFGIRGDDFSDGQQYRILAIGGSTTECLFLDESEAWPYLLQEMMNAKLGKPKIWVGNVGKSGLNTRHHILQVQKLLPQYPEIDAIILLIGINDLHQRLSLDVNYVPYSLESPGYRVKLFSKAFSEVPMQYTTNVPLYKRTEIWHRLLKIKERLLKSDSHKGHVQDDSGNIYITWRWNRLNAGGIMDVLPDLTSALEEYAQNVNTIVDFATDRGVRVVLVTQPVLWRPDLPGELRSLLWMGGIGDFQAQSGKEYYSVKALSAAMKKYNETLLTVCRNREVECIDLASLLPKDTTIFYDDVHFNEGGARKTAVILADYLLQHDPLRGMREE